MPPIFNLQAVEACIHQRIDVTEHGVTIFLNPRHFHFLQRFMGICITTLLSSKCVSVNVTIDHWYILISLFLSQNPKGAVITVVIMVTNGT